FARMCSIRIKTLKRSTRNSALRSSAIGQHMKQGTLHRWKLKMHVLNEISWNFLRHLPSFQKAKCSHQPPLRFSPHAPKCSDYGQRTTSYSGVTAWSFASFDD